VFELRSWLRGSRCLVSRCSGLGVPFAVELSLQGWPVAWRRRDQCVTSGTCFLFLLTTNQRRSYSGRFQGRFQATKRRQGTRLTADAGVWTPLRMACLFRSQDPKCSRIQLLPRRSLAVEIGRALRISCHEDTRLNMRVGSAHRRAAGKASRIGLIGAGIMMSWCSRRPESAHRNG
jgi:hypothetical protein